MKGLPFVLLFTAMTFLAWGSYGPVLHHGAEAFRQDSMRAFAFVGLAYFLIAVIVPILLMRKSKESGEWTLSGIVYSLLAGTVGALGALGVILALGYGGRPVYVMPLVFGFAPVVNTLLTALLSGTFKQIRPLFIFGIVAAAVGAAGVLVFKPGPIVEKQPVAVSSEIDADEETTETSMARKAVSLGGIAMSIVMAALCWGAYGPVLHIGQGRMNGSRLRPFICVGMAYFFIAVAAPLVIIAARTADSGSWTLFGMSWSFLAGVAGAIGALGVIYAFNAGGKPYYVMPLIFGFAPVVNTFISLTENGAWARVGPAFWGSLAVVITGAVIVLTNAPKSAKNPPQDSKSEGTDGGRGDEDANNGQAAAAEELSKGSSGGVDVAKPSDAEDTEND